MGAGNRGDALAGQGLVGCKRDFRPLQSPSTIEDLTTCLSNGVVVPYARVAPMHMGLFFAASAPS